MFPDDCLHDRTAIYREPASGQAVQECLACGTVVDRGDPGDFWRGHATTVGGFTPPDAVAGGEAVGGLPAR